MTRKVLILISALAVLAACARQEDTRFFAPAVSFGSSSYQANPSQGGLDIDVVLSRPATQDFTIGLVIDSSLEEGVQYSVSPDKLDIAKGHDRATIHVTLVDDEIWIKSAWINISMRPGERYTVDPERAAETRVNVSKEINLPVFRLVEKDVIETNPYLEESITLTLEGDRAAAKDIEVTLIPEGFVYGEDYVIEGSHSSGLVFPSGVTSLAFRVNILRKDTPGIEKSGKLRLVPKKGDYTVSPGEDQVSFLLSDPVVDFKPLLKTAALQGGDGYQVRQAILEADGESWNGNTTVDLGLSAEGSNYLRNYRNMYDHPSFGCKANASVSQFLRLPDLMPMCIYPNKTNVILDYGNDQGHREFSPADSLMRFVLAKGETLKGTIHLSKPRTFKAYLGSYETWQDKSSGYNVWVKDSKATGGDIDASTHSAITGAVYVTLEKLEGTFDFTNSDAPVLITAWLTSESDLFMKADTENGNDPASAYKAQKDGNAWKISYKLWPR